MRQRLEGAGYVIAEKRLSPHQFGIPQIRDRVYIVGCRAGLSHFQWPLSSGRGQTSIVSALDGKSRDAKPLPKQVIDCLTIWQEFVEKYPKDGAEEKE